MKGIGYYELVYAVQWGQCITLDHNGWREKDLVSRVMVW